MTVDCFAAESAVWMVGHYIDSGCPDNSIEAAISKVFASEAMFRTANESLRRKSQCQLTQGVTGLREQAPIDWTRLRRIVS